MSLVTALRAYVKESVLEVVAKKAKQRTKLLSNAAFAELDVDGDGAVSRAEFAEWHEREGGAAPTEGEWRAFAEADADGDGAVSLREFEAFAARAARRQINLQRQRRAANNEIQLRVRRPRVLLRPGQHTAAAVTLDLLDCSACKAYDMLELSVPPDSRLAAQIDADFRGVELPLLRLDATLGHLTLRRHGGTATLHALVGASA